MKRKAKTTVGDLTVMNLTLGVRTRAKTLALRHLHQQQSHHNHSTSAPSVSGTATATSTYLQLRSRRLEKLPVAVRLSKRQKLANDGDSSRNVKKGRKSNRNLKAVSKMEVGSTGSESVRAKNNKGKVNSKSKRKSDEDSCGENVLDCEGRERGIKLERKVAPSGPRSSHANSDSEATKEPNLTNGENAISSKAAGNTRESTPCSLIRTPESITTPGSTTRPTARRTRNSAPKHIPAAHELDELFSEAEEEKQKQFMDKYNYDPVNDKPLPGRYEWKKLDP